MVSNSKSPDIRVNLSISFINSLLFRCYRTAHIWTLTESRRNTVHQILTDHEKQFAYLPMDILKKATNICELVLPTIAKGKPQFVELVIGQIYRQMPTKCGKWCRELANLRFVETIEDAENNHDDAKSSATESRSSKRTVQKQSEPDPEPVPSTSKTLPKATKNASTSNETATQSSRVTRNRKVSIEIS